MRLLLLVHRLPPDETSGSPLQAHGYAQALTALGHDVVVATTDDRLGTPEPATLEPHPTGDYRVASFAGTHARWTDWAQSDWQTASRSPGSRDRAFRKLLAKFRPDLVHVVDLVHLPSEWPRLAAAQGIPVVRTFCNAEDLCGMIEPIHAPGGRCETPITPASCATHCARGRQMTLPPTTATLGDLADRASSLIDEAAAELTPRLEIKRAQLLHDLEHTYAACVFATSAWRDYFGRSVPLPEGRTHVIPLGTTAPPTPKTTTVNGHLTFGYIGPPTQNKGLDILHGVASDPRVAERSDIRFAIHTSWSSGNELGQRQMASLRDTELRGAFEPEDLGQVVGAIDVGLSLSRFETFHRVTREFLAAGRPVIGTDAPGIGEVLVDEHNGLSVEVGDVEGVVRAVLRLADDRALLATCREGAATTRIASPADELAALVDLYESLVTADQASSVEATA